jgi:hypothetical protein
LESDTHIGRLELWQKRGIQAEISIHLRSKSGLHCAGKAQAKWLMVKGLLAGAPNLPPQQGVGCGRSKDGQGASPDRFCLRSTHLGAGVVIENSCLQPLRAASEPVLTS